MPDRRKKAQFYKRVFLNREGFHGVASSLSYIDAFGWGELIISDCGRQIALCIDCGGTVEDRANTLEKLDALYEMVKETRKAARRAARKKYPNNPIA